MLRVKIGHNILHANVARYTYSREDLSKQNSYISYIHKFPHKTKSVATAALTQLAATKLMLIIAENISIKNFKKKFRISRKNFNGAVENSQGKVARLF